MEKSISFHNQQPVRSPSLSRLLRFRQAMETSRTRFPPSFGSLQCPFFPINLSPFLVCDGPPEIDQGNPYQQSSDLPSRDRAAYKGLKPISKKDMGGQSSS
ncbi:hypothetical protein AAC387_Pa03g1361 [Persea americana]